MAVVAPLPEPSTSYPLRKLAFTFGLALLFLRASMLHQIQAQLMGFSLRLLPALAGLAIALDRTARAEFTSRAAQVLEPPQPPWDGPSHGFRTGVGWTPAGLARATQQTAS